MKSFACGAVVPNCIATFRAEDEDQLLGQVAEHARRDHGMETVPPALVDQVRLHIRTE